MVRGVSNGGEVRSAGCFSLTSAPNSAKHRQQMRAASTPHVFASVRHPSAVGFVRATTFPHSGPDRWTAPFCLLGGLLVISWHSNHNHQLVWLFIAGRRKIEP